MSSTSPISRLQEQFASIREALTSPAAHTQWQPNSTEPLPLLHSQFTPDGSLIQWISPHLTQLEGTSIQATLQMHNEIHLARLALLESPQ